MACVVMQNELNPNYPIDGLGSQRHKDNCTVYSTEGKIKLFVYDLVTQDKAIQIDLTKDFDLVQDIKYML